MATVLCKGVAWSTAFKSACSAGTVSCRVVSCRVVSLQVTSAVHHVTSGSDGLNRH
jgi:hypothetical protein